MKTLVPTLALALAAVPALASEETLVPMDQVPAAVLEVAMANAQGVTFESVALDDGVYEFTGKMANGMQLEVDVTAEGKIEEIEEQISADMLPEPVAAALAQNLPGFEPTFIEKSTRADGSVVYEFEGMLNGQEIGAEIAADGTGFTSNLDTAG